MAKGAALVANSFLNASSNDNIQLLFNDIVPLSIGQRTSGDLMRFSIKRGTKYPCKVLNSYIFSRVQIDLGYSNN